MAVTFGILNDIQSVETIEENQIPYFANIFRVLHSLTEDPSVYDELDYQNFLKRCFEIREGKKKLTNKRKNKLKERIQNIIVEYEKKASI